MIREVCWVDTVYLTSTQHEIQQGHCCHKDLKSLYVIRCAFRDSFSGDIDAVSLLRRTRALSLARPRHLDIPYHRDPAKVGELENWRIGESEKVRIGVRAKRSTSIVSNTTS